MKLTIHRGTHEIGGSCVEVQTAQTRLILDVGLPLVDANKEPFDQRAIKQKSVEELLTDGTLPNVPGLFQPGSSIEAILLSHSHLDHSGLLHLTRAEIPIFASSGTSKMMLATAVFGGQRALDRDRHRIVDHGESVRIGDIEITPFSVDHSSFGSMAYLLDGGGKRLLYSGDLRAHGRKPGMLQTLLNATADMQIDVLLMEGTHFGSGRPKGIKERQLEEKLVKVVESAPGLVLTCFSPIDLDRLVTNYRAARRGRRTFVVDAYAAFVMHLVASEVAIPEPAPANGIRVYFNSHFLKRKIGKLERLFAASQIELDEVLSEPGEYLMNFRPSMLAADFGGRLPEATRCIYSYWQGYLDRSDWVELREHLSEVAGDFIPAHASGHIYIEDLIKFIQSVDPNVIVPIHTFEPTAFREHFGNVIVLEDGQVLEV